MAEGELQITIRPLQPGDTVSGLSLGDPDFAPLKAFLKSQAKRFEERSLARTYGAYRQENPQKVIGYITLVCGEIESSPSIADVIGSDFSYKHCPTIKIARLAVDQRYKKRGIGQALVELAMGIAVTEVASRVGCRFIVVDAKKKAVKFYAEKCGFTLLDTDENRSLDAPIMFIDLLKAAASALSAEGSS